jgi:hypothetical protein
MKTIISHRIKDYILKVFERMKETQLRATLLMIQKLERKPMNGTLVMKVAHPHLHPTDIMQEDLDLDPKTQ